MIRCGCVVWSRRLRLLGGQCCLVLSSCGLHSRGRCTCLRGRFHRAILHRPTGRQRYQHCQAYQAKTFRFILSLFSLVLTLAWLEMEEFMQKSKAKCALLFLLRVFSAAFFIFFPATTGTWCISVNLMADGLLAQMILLCDLLTLFL